LLPNYNILTEAGYKHTEITRLKMKANYNLERKVLIGNFNRGNEDTIQKIKQSALIRKKAIYSETALANMKKNYKTIIIYNLDYTVYGKYSSIIKAL